MAMILAIVAAIPLVLIYARISTLFKERNLFDMLFEVFGKQLGWLISLLMTLYCFQLGTLVLRDFPEFVQVVSLPNTPKIIFATLVGLICAYLAKLGINSLGKAGILFSAVVGAVVVLTFLFLLPKMDAQHLLPVLATKWDVLGLNTAKLFTLPLGETVLLLCLFCNLKAGQSKYKTYVFGLMFGGSYLIISILRNILSLGAGNFTSLYYSSYNAVSTINIGDFFQRVEVMVASYLLLCDIVKIAVAVYATSLGVAKLLNISDYKKVVLPVAWLMIALSPIVYKNTMEFFKWSDKYFYFSLPFQVCIPLILWIWGESNKKKLRA